MFLVLKCCINRKNYQEIKELKHTKLYTRKVMKILFYFYSCFNPTFFGSLLDEAIKLKENSQNDVLFIYCGGLNQMCLFNKSGSKHLCRFCSNSTRRILNKYLLNSAPLTDYYIENELTFDYQNSKELGSIVYRGVNIGKGFMSSFISGTRNLNPKVDVKSRRYFDAHLSQLVRMVDAMYNLIDVYQPDCIYSFNGRYEEVRAVYDITQRLKIKCYLGECFINEVERKKIFLEDHLPHDIKYWVSLRDYCWDHYKMTEEEKKELGHSFFIKRRCGIYAGDKIYIKDQKAGNIPLIDKNKINIAIMNSSEDEFSAVGGEWDYLQLFPNQYDAIIYMLEHGDSSIHFYLRIHPNLKNVPFRYHTDLLKLEEKYKNVTVIQADSDISTYSLMDCMDKIIVFGSTMGIESAYWKKATILLGPSLYFYDDICYRPKEISDLKRLMVSKLEPKFNDSIIKFGAFVLNSDPIIVPDYKINYQLTERTFAGQKYHTTPFISGIINEKVTGLYTAINRYLLGLHCFTRFSVPVEEDL